MSPATKSEKIIIAAAKAFAQTNNIPVSKMTELVILFAIRDVKNIYNKSDFGKNFYIPSK